ncbi:MULTISPECIES: hypothetical protein [Clostridia]|uniref:GAP1-N1 domain-containing protein n=1 Tax=Clostridia TaxID=186801 RepID=UPI00067EF9F2|nr:MULTISPECIES: hypothetical protein [Clostridia]
MTIENLYINQTLHGYSNGHRLISSSEKMNDNDAKKMTILSDLSGNEFVTGFEKYYTGYSLENNKIVIACTWYADEMSRPGCVWTHSLIFDNTAFQKYNKIGDIFSLFKRPSVYEKFTYYEKPLVMHFDKELNINDEQLKYIIWCIWGNKKPIIIFNNDSAEYENEIVYLFLTQNDLLGLNFSFCTGSISLRSYDNQILQLQISPYKISRSRLSIGDKAFEAKDRKIIKNYPMWVNKVLEYMFFDNMKDFKKFRAGFSSKYKQVDYFSAFVKLYVGSKADCGKLNLNNLLKMATAIFQDKKGICDEILKLHKQGYFTNWMGKEEYIETIEFLLNNQWLDTSLFDFSAMLNKGFGTDYFGAKRLFKKIIKLDENPVVEEVLNIYSKIIPEDKFVDFTDLEYAGCSALVTLNSNYATCPRLWNQSKGYQQGIIGCLDKSFKTESTINRIIEGILHTSKYDLSSELYKVYGKHCFKSFWEYLLLNRSGDKANGIKNIVKKDVIGGVQKIKNNLNDRATLLFLIDIVDSYDLSIQQLSNEDYKILFSTVKSQKCSQGEEETLASFFIPICITGEYLLPVDIAEYSFSIVNSLLATQSFPEEKWEKLEKLLPQVAYYNNWDKCKRLRKGFKKKGYQIKDSKVDKLPVHLL